MRKKVWPLWMVVALGLLLAACGGGGSKTASSGDPSPVSEASSETIRNDDYTISGTIVDTDGRGIPGVTVFAFMGDSATTDEDGKWSVSGLSGSVRLSPHHVDYDFDPEMHSVHGPETAVDFIGIPDGCPPTSPCKVSDVNDLQNIRDDLSGHYILVDDIDATDTKNWNDGKGFEPIGSRAQRFTGSLDGDGFAIIGLHIDRPNDDYVALFGSLDRNGTIRNLGLRDGSVTGGGRVASLVAWSEGTVENAYNSNAVEGQMVGGLISRLNEATVRNSYNTGTVTGTESTVGGLVSENYGGTIEHSYNEGTVTAPGNHVGGVAADNSYGIIKYSYNTGDISGGETVGGVVSSNSTDSYIGYSYNTGSVSGTGWSAGGVAGSNGGGTIEYSWNGGDVATEYRQAGGVAGTNAVGGTIAFSYNTGNIKAAEGTAGGVAGQNDSSAFGTMFNTITNSYSSGEVKGTSAVGGLVGSHHGSATIEQSYSTGTVRVIEGHWTVPDVGGLVGEFKTERNTEYPDSIQASFYDVNYYQDGSAEVIHTEKGTAKTAEELKDKATFADDGWDFDTIWTINDGIDYPDLIDNLRP